MMRFMRLDRHLRSTALELSLVEVDSPALGVCVTVVEAAAIFSEQRDRESLGEANIHLSRQLTH